MADLRFRVVHTTQGRNSLGWLLNPVAQVSYTWYVPIEGPDIYRVVPEGDAAWHAGAVCDPITTDLYTGENPNRYSEGVGFEGFAAEPLSPFQLGAWKQINAADPLPWCGHYNLAGCNRTDPGVGNMAALAVALVEDDMALTPEQATMLVEVHTLSHQMKNLLEMHFKTPVTARHTATRESKQRGEWDGPGSEPLTVESRRVLKMVSAKGGKKK